jgi:bis(5'-nucleosyl)-tetraphosphatase (symmetrical)
MRTFAIGDIQGCFAEFEQLLKQIRFDPEQDRLWLVGDLVNRGPQSLQVLRKVRSLGASAITVLGNHDLHLLAAALSPAESLKPKDTLGEIFSAPDCDELLHWLRHRPMLHTDHALGYTMVHAGFAPQWDLAQAQACARELEAALRDPDRCVELFAHMYGDKPDQWSAHLQGAERLRFITNCFTRLRFCSEDGRLELKYKGTLDKAPKGLMPWFKVPERRWHGTRIVCGHWSALGYHREEDVLAIDTGCVWGERLCAVRLDQADPSPVFTPCSSSGLTADS